MARTRTKRIPRSRAAAEPLPPGPSTVQEAFACHHAAAKCLQEFDASCGGRFVANVSGMTMDGDFAGIGFGKFGLAGAVAGMASQGHVLTTPFAIGRECEVDKSCQQILTHESDAILAKHVVGDIMTTVIPRVARRLDMIENTYLTKNMSDKSHPSFSTDEVELNLFDGKPPTTKQLKQQTKVKPPKSKKSGNVYGWDLLGMYMEVLTKDGSPFKRSSPCLAHPDELEGALGGCPTKTNDEMPDAKIMNFTGSPCIPWSTLGDQHQLMHTVSKPFAVYLCHIKETRPEWGGHECTPAFPVKILEHYLGGEYNIWTILVAPTTFGFPVGGARRITLFAKKCYAPVHNMSDIVMLARRVNMTGDEYMIATDADVLTHRLRMARKRCVGPATEWIGLLNPGQVKCLGDARATQRYEKLRAEHGHHLMVNPD